MNEMSRCSHSELRATDSEDLGCLDLILLPSEPPDIGNWFSSYVYESPELNTLDGFQDFDGPGETFVEDGKSAKSEDGRPVGKFNDALLDVSKKPSDGIECNESDEFECSKSASLVTASESISFSSEPPDIKNWFSSYTYESPLLDTTHDFVISDYKEMEDGKPCMVQMNCRQDKTDVVAFVGAEQRTELYSQSRHQDVVVRCTNLVKDTKLDYQPDSKDVHSVAHRPTLSEQRTLNNYHGYVEMSENTHIYGDNGNLHFSSTEERSTMSMNVEKIIGSLDGESVHKLIGRIVPVKESVEKEHLHEIASPGTLDLTVPKANSRERLSDHRSSYGKENKLPENGFISIRKTSSQVKAENVMRHAQVEVESLRNEVEARRNQGKDGKIVRKVLSEIYNYPSGNIQERSGKWRCPQKNKPDLGPPLKQLCLDQWFYRV